MDARFPSLDAWLAADERAAIAGRAVVRAGLKMIVVNEPIPAALIEEAAAARTVANDLKAAALGALPVSAVR